MQRDQSEDYSRPEDVLVYRDSPLGGYAVTRAVDEPYFAQGKRAALEDIAESGIRSAQHVAGKLRYAHSGEPVTPYAWGYGLTVAHAAAAEIDDQDEAEVASKYAAMAAWHAGVYLGIGVNR